MLLIGDIHINAKFKDKIIVTLQNFINEHNEEKNIIFVGDYMYHFSYDRKALLELFTFFLELYKNGKNIYVLAGNHDWINNMFLYQEVVQTLESLTTKSDHILKFITKPCIEKIENKNVFFVPFTLSQNDFPTEITFDGIEKNRGNTNDNIISNIEKIGNTLKTSEHKKEIFSGHLNYFVSQTLKKYHIDTVIHHYYTAETKFPGQFSQFSYKDIALSSEILNLENIKIISGHLHKAFQLKNYLCVGSVWATDPIEINQGKFLFIYNTKEEKVLSFPIGIHQQISIEDTFIDGEKQLSINDIIETTEKIYGNHSNELTKHGMRKIENHTGSQPTLTETNLSISSQKLQYDTLENHIDPKLMKEIKDIKIKKNLPEVEGLMQKFSIEGKNFELSFVDRKNILMAYIKEKHPETHEEYIDILREIGVM